MQRVLELSSSTRGKRRRRYTRGTTVVEYGLILFLMLCVAGLAFKVLGITLERKVGAANKHMQGQGESASAPQAGQTGQSGQSADNSAAGGGAKAGVKTSDSMNKDPTSTNSAGDGEPQSGGGLPMIAR